MITATILAREGRIVSYEISGHAESGEYGHDVVCAAVSVLGITTANNLYKLAKVKPLANMDEGYLSVELPLSVPKKNDVTAQVLLKAFLYAMEEVAKEYQDYITLQIEK